MQKLFQKLDKSVVRLVEIFVGSTLIFISLLVFANSMLRYLFGANQNWVEEVARIMMVWMTFIGASLCVRTGEHVVMDMVLSRLKPKAHRMVKVIIGAIGAVTTTYLFYLSCVYVANTFKRGQFSPILGVATGVIYLCLPIGYFLMTKDFIGTTIREYKEGGAKK